MSKCKVCHIHTARDPYGLCDFCNPPYDQYAPCGIRECANCNQQSARITELEQANAELRSRLAAMQCEIERIRDVAEVFDEMAALGELNDLLAARTNTGGE